MSYSLRPGNKLKRPTRYQSESDDELDNIPEPRNDVAATHNAISALPAHNVFGGVALQSQSVAQSQLTLTSHSTTPFASTVRAAPHYPTTTLDSRKLTEPQGFRKMANMRHVRKRLHRSRGDERRETARDVSSSVLAGRAAQDNPMSIFPSLKPAAFPSLPTDGSLPDQALHSHTGHGVRMLMEAMEKCSEKGIAHCKRLVDSMYSTTGFPAHVDARERTWYEELRAHWPPSASTREVSQIIYEDV